MIALLLRRAMPVLLVAAAVVLVAFVLVKLFLADVDSSWISFGGVGLLLLVGWLIHLLTAPLRGNPRASDADGAPADAGALEP